MTKPEQTTTLADVHSLTTPVAMACVRSLAYDATLDPGGNWYAEVQADTDPARVASHRGDLDAMAMRHQYHDEQIHVHFAPTDAIELLLFDALEQARYESIGANRYSGVQVNLDAREIPASAADRPNQNMDFLSDANRLKLAAFVLGQRAFRFDAVALSPQLQTIALSNEFAVLSVAWSAGLGELAELREDQAAFANKARDIVQRWRTSQNAAKFDSDESPGRVDEGDSTDEPPDVDTPADDETAEEFLADEASASDTDNLKEESAPAEGEAQAHEGDATATPLMDEAPMGGADPTFNSGVANLPYKAFTTEFDETCLPADFADQQSLENLRAQLDQHIDLHARLVRRLASRLQRVLLARQRRQWQFDMEEGHLDTARLSRVVSDPLMPLSFKCESEAPIRDTTITLLIDNSRSMLGRPIMIAAAATDILARTLERCGVSVEILGFTTVHLHGGRSTQAWEAAGKPQAPGRLNDVRHIVYKSADTPYRNARRHLGLMLDKDILKQNIDGEALQWASQRLLKRPEKRRILMMISDGAPVETSTLSANSDDYLVGHLHNVISDIERAGAIELLAIGIGHDVSQFYSNALSVFDVRQLGPAMLNELGALLRRGTI